MGGVLPYKWEAYCRVSLSSKLRSQESTAIQMGGVLPYKWEVYCRTFQTGCRGWGFRKIAQYTLFKAWPRERALWPRERAPKMCRLVCQKHNGIQTSINVKRPCWVLELPGSVRPHLYMCVQKMHAYIYIYIVQYAGELSSEQPKGPKRVRNCTA